ncbi:MAG TPA: (2Fe-2S)-binding protein [Bacillota bacterium]|jgi:carbon-monoxide dehydrogenase small subunit|nr:(2Fe-2S)-binding protein [Bacillota bacterium]HQI15726.1 (2Fe-2S)-binding protein [Bacillota bacterium]HQJ36614.1 (2Fe-2S)-binding protein [Bacillota bacterium]HQL36911.1 (2Fe-2S)-binding protein [Bacillota bacterium]HRS20443.1 (2Fe-2S)-binding protein [Clostridia bacterium]
MIINAVINGESIEKECNPNKRLIDFLRDDMELLSVKEGCGEGECGSCTVLLDKEAVTSCTVLTGQINGHEVTTVEGLDAMGELEPIMESFISAGAVQCGYCTPGMIISAKALLYKNPNPTDEEIKRALEGNLCRCTGYNKIIEAVRNIKR